MNKKNTLMLVVLLSVAICQKISGALLPKMLPVSVRAVAGARILNIRRHSSDFLNNFPGVQPVPVELNDSIKKILKMNPALGIRTYRLGSSTAFPLRDCQIAMLYKYSNKAPLRPGENVADRICEHNIILSNDLADLFNLRDDSKKISKRIENENRYAQLNFNPEFALPIIHSMCFRDHLANLKIQEAKFNNTAINRDTLFIDTIRHVKERNLCEGALLVEFIVFMQALYKAAPGQIDGVHANHFLQQVYTMILHPDFVGSRFEDGLFNADSSLKPIIAVLRQMQTIGSSKKQIATIELKDSDSKSIIPVVV